MRLFKSYEFRRSIPSTTIYDLSTYKDILFRCSIEYTGEPHPDRLLLPSARDIL